MSRTKCTVCLLLLCAGSLLRAATFTVTKTTDSGTGTLRDAITQANLLPGPDTIVFSLSGGGGVKTITPLTPLPIIIDPVTIDGWSQGGPGYTGPPLIEINGSAIPTLNIGLHFWSGLNTVRGLIINRFSSAGIALVTNGNNTIQGNYIGTDGTGTLNLGNTNDGIVIVNSAGNLIGGTNVAARNVISGNDFGITLLNNNARNNRIQGNYIGLNAAGSAAIPNREAGILLNALEETPGDDYASDNVIGGTVPGARNVISGNIGAGIWAFSVGSPAFVGPTRNRIIGNYIGTAADGVTAIPNIGAGVELDRANGNIVGGLSTLGERNIISGNVLDGILIENSYTNVVQGNFIGTDVTGMLARGNLLGVTITGGAGNIIGGTNVPTGNIISGNSIDGVHLEFGTSNNFVCRNLIGFNSNGVAFLPNQRHGVALFSASHNTIGLPDGGNNFIAGNLSNGVFIGRGVLTSGSVSNRVQGNLIATNGLDGVQLNDGANGNEIFGNIIGGNPNFVVPLHGNGRHGVAIFDSTNNIIGWNSSDWTRNSISGNRSNGVFMGNGPFASGSWSNIVRGNQIGNNVVGNGGAGIFVQGNANMIGGFGDRDGNMIGFNGKSLKQRGHGVVIESGTNNAILGNKMSGNAGRGIDLGNDSFTVNDRGDGDNGANELQNYPVVTRVFFDRVKGANYITWTLNSQSNRLYYLEFFSNPEPNRSGFGEGETFLGWKQVSTDASGVAVVTVEFPSKDKFISATATDVTDLNTSEFSPIDTDGDAIADGWEQFGVDVNEDGTNDLTLLYADPMHKDVYVEVDTMMNRWPSQNGVDMLSIGIGGVGGFAQAPNELVQNPDQEHGITLHAEFDELDLTLEPWTNTWPKQFDLAKAGLLADHTDGRFGTKSNRLSSNWLNIRAARQLVYRYCIIAEKVPLAGGQGELGGNDFYVAQGENTDEEFAGAFMHELGHTLGLHHGGGDEVNYKQNYHSIMNYIWTDRSSSYPEGWKLDYSHELLPSLNENNLNEFLGLGGISAYRIPIGPIIDPTTGNFLARRLVPEGGTIDFNTNGMADPVVALDITYIRADSNLDGVTNAADATPGEVLFGHQDWSQLTYYFVESAGARDGDHDSAVPNDIPPEVFADLDRIGTGLGLFEFSQPQYLGSETGGVAIISVKRTFEAEGLVSVSFAALNGSATNGLDYVATNGVLFFSGAESNKDFVVPILNDGSAEATETVRLVLTNPTGGATVGLRNQATLIITDDDPPGHFTVINTNNSGAGSLRQAMLDANGALGIAIIDFNIPAAGGRTISPTTALPTLTNRITIDGTTQPGFAGVPIIELNGASAGASDGLRLSARGCIVRGLVINRFNGNGINLLAGGENRIEGCYIGLNRLGTLDQGNTANGISVQTGDNVIGGITAEARNFISGNNASGIALNGDSATNNQVQNNVIGLGINDSDQGNSGSGITINASLNVIGTEKKTFGNVISGNDQHGINIGSGAQNRILGNLIGTGLAGTNAVGNSSHGIRVSTTGHVIGGDSPAAANVISGNTLRGIELAGAFLVQVRGNRIGTDISGKNPLPNQAGGIVVIGFSIGNQIGNTNDSAGNTIAFNNGPGIALESTAAVNNTMRGNSIFSNNRLGIELNFFGTGNDTNDTDVGANQLQNFPILTRASNSAAGTLIVGTLNSRPNTNFTIDFYASSAADPFGTGEGESWIGSTNVVTDGNGNASFTAPTPAIYLKGRHITATATDAAGNTSEFSPAVFADTSIASRTFTVVTTNDSGPGSLRQAILDANGFASERDKIEFDIPGGGVQTIRPLSPLPAIEDPIFIDGYSQPGSSPNTASVGHNGLLRIELDGSLAGAAHGLEIRAGNSIVRGLVINRFAAGASSSDLPCGLLLTTRGGNLVEGNFIGTDASGFLDRGNAFRGIAIYHCSSNVIGGTLPAARNVISGNDIGGGTVSGEAILLVGDSVLQFPFPGNRIEGNLLGTAADGVSPLGNSGSAVRLNQPVINTTIGGTTPGAGNVIAFNSAADPPANAGGIGDPLAFGPRGIGILGNSIHSNFGPGIGGNQLNSADGRGNFPLLSAASSSNGLTTIQGRLHSVSNAPHRIEFFANASFDPTGFGEGQILLGATNLPTDSNGFAAFIAVLPFAASNGMYVTATATDDKNNTSEFSPRLRVGDVLTSVFVVNSINDVDDGVANTNHTSLREAIMAANNHSGPDLIRFAIGSGARTIGLTNFLPALLDAETTIDATTQPGFAGQPLIYLHGSLVVPSGLRLYSPSNTVRGFAINRFGFGIAGEGAFASPFGGFNVIEGNYLGTDPAGGDVGGQDFGLYLNGGCPGNRIGGPTSAARNIISGNRRAGAFIFDSASNTFAGNFVGTDRTGTNSLGNGFAALNPLGGLFIQRARGTVIGGSAPGMGNLIAGNRSLFQNELFLWDDSSGSVVQGNYIGTDLTGRTNLGSGMTAIDVSGTGRVLIKSNLLSGAGFTAALYLACSSNRVEGNFIGTDVTGTRAILASRCIFIDAGGSGNIIGGTNAESPNLLSGAQYGVRINGPSNVVQGNFIGTKIDGASPLGNFGDGVIVQQSFNLIGGVGPGEGNIIAFNSGSGVLVSAGTNNAILGNSIFSNTNLAVDLGTLGITTNDLADLDSGPNNLQNFPIISAARNIGASTILEGTLNSRSNTAYRIEFFSNTNCHSSGNGDGRTFLNATTATTDGSGNAAFSFTHPIPVTAGLKITATATDPNNNTSEFSPCATVINDTNHVVLSFSTSLPYTLSWPTSAANFLLERSTNLTPPAAWQVITSGIAVSGGVNVLAITNHPNSPTIFFRLRRP